MAEMFLEILRDTWTNYASAARAFLPRVLATLSIVLVGWLLALLFALLTRKVLGWIRLERLSERTGTAELLKKAELPPANQLAGTVVFWLVFVGFLLSGLDALGFRGVDGLFSDFVRFIPRLVVAVLVLIVGFLVANFAWRACLLAGVNANLTGSRLLAGGVRVLIVVLTAAMALEQIGIARGVVLAAFAITFGAVMLSVAIAFGIAAAGLARRLVEEQFVAKEKASPDGMSHL
jgi:Mechanosensitive ion channel, conserved TM helix